MAFKFSDVNEIDEAGSKTVSNSLEVFQFQVGRGGKNWQITLPARAAGRAEAITIKYH
jgi:hypothetical protein